MSWLLLFKMAAPNIRPVDCGINNGFLPSLYDHITCVRDLNDPSSVATPTIQTISDLVVMLGNAIRILLALAGGVAVVVIIVAAIYYVTANGDPARIKRAKEILINMATGLVIMLAGYGIVTFIAAGF